MVNPLATQKNVRCTPKPLPRLQGDKVNPCPWKIQVKVGNEYTIHEGATSNLRTNNFVCDINYTGKTDNEGGAAEK